MNIAFCRVPGIVIATLLIVACNDENNVRPNTDHAMTAEKYALIDMAIDEMVEAGDLPSGGRFIIADQTTMSDLAERFMESDETVDAASALDFSFPYDFLPWTLDEADLAFGAYYRANLEPVDVRLEDLTVLERDTSLLMHEQFKEYLVDDPWAGWDAFHADYPDAAGYVRLGNPVIFDEAGFALVHVDFTCGALCGIGFYALFSLETGQWTFVDWYADWVS